MFTGLWYMFIGLWYMYSGLGYMFTGFWYMFIGLWYMFTGLWYMFTGLWYMFTGLWYMFIGLWYMFTGLWYMFTGLWYIRGLGVHQPLSSYQRGLTLFVCPRVNNVDNVICFGFNLPFAYCCCVCLAVCLSGFQPIRMIISVSANLYTLEFSSGWA